MTTRWCGDAGGDACFLAVSRQHWVRNERGDHIAECPALYQKGDNTLRVDEIGLQG